ncbi:MAG: DNA topoisomerase (ATP-hydrolyzing) subunit A [Oscillospiraceae bacterium]|nr:DNA topoisomerase (ATP-hydrolyzing) subunit A [Oscillospiraceae bacterium]
MPKQKNYDNDNSKNEKIIKKQPAPAVDQKITDTIETNYMPYVMTVIMSRAIPEIDGLKPSHRKLLYTMYKMGLLPSSANKTKSANVVGQTMRLNPHGELAIYDALVRLSKGNEALLHPLIDSKGSFGKQYSRDMAYAASRYTECKLDSICNELFDGIDRDAVDFTDNYDNTQKEPVLLPTSFPNILVAPNQGLAVGMASNICSFNLIEVCDTTIQILKKENTTTKEIMQTLKAPDFSTGGQLIYNETAIEEIYNTGKGSIKVRARYTYDKSQNCIDIYQIPYTATIEAIQEKVEQLVKDGKIKEINDIRDETDLGGLKITIDLKRGTDPEKIMSKLFKLTQLEDNFPCNFNVLIAGTPRLLGVKDILTEWIAFRIECVKRELYFDLNKKQEKLHLLNGLKKILLDIDKVIKIVRETKTEQEVVPNLMSAFKLDEVQAEYVAEIKLRHLNREYILERIKEIEELEKDIADISETLSSPDKQKKIIIKQLENVKKKYGKQRLTQIIYTDDSENVEETEEIENYPVHLILTRDGYFKKITAQSLRGNDEQKLKETDEIILEKEGQNTDDVLFFTDKGQVYKARIYEFDNTKASALGDYIPAKLSFDDGEKIIYANVTGDYSGNLMIFFANGKTAKIPLEAYATKTNRKKLTGAFSVLSPVVAIFHETASDAQSSESEYLLISSDNKAIVINSSAVPLKTTRTTIGVDTIQLPKGRSLSSVIKNPAALYKHVDKYKKSKIPARGSIFESVDIEKEQISIIDDVDN